MFFIHQKDAAIACHVVDSCQRLHYNVYSVHDCFIAPAACAYPLAAYYCFALSDLMNPCQLLY